MMTKTVSLKNLRPRLPEIINEIDSKMDRFVITKRGKPTALIMAIDDYESILETLDILSNKRLMKKIKQAEDDIEKGRVKSIDDIEKEMGLA